MMKNENKEELDIETRQIYSEVYEILNILGDSFVYKLPKSLYEILKEKRDTNYQPKYNNKISLNEQNIKKETFSILALLHLNYWCENENERQELNKIFIENENKYQEEIREKYNPDEIFKNKKQRIIPSQENENKEKNLIVYRKSLLTRVLNKIKSIFQSKH